MFGTSVPARDPENWTSKPLAVGPTVAPNPSTSGTVPAVCGDTCGGEAFDFNLLGPNTQLCAIGFGQAQSINGNLLTLLAERQGGIYMQSPAKGPTDQEGVNGQGRWVDLKDFFVKCFAQLVGGQVSFP